MLDHDPFVFLYVYIILLIIHFPSIYPTVVPFLFEIPFVVELKTAFDATLVILTRSAIKNVPLMRLGGANKRKASAHYFVPPNRISGIIF